MKISAKKSYHKLFCLIGLGLLAVSWCSVTLFMTASAPVKQQVQHKRFGDLHQGMAAFEEIRDSILDYQSASHESHANSSHADEIIPGLYVGNKHTVQSLPSDVSAVISCRSHPQRPQISEAIVWKSIAVPDKASTDLTQYFDEVYDFIEHATTGVLIHCNRGISRSPSLVIAYLMKKFDVPYTAAYHYVSKKHPACNPNSSFERQLKAYEATLQK